MAVHRAIRGDELLREEGAPPHTRVRRWTLQGQDPCQPAEYDNAPELTDEFFDVATPPVNGVEQPRPKRGRPPSLNPKVPTAAGLIRMCWSTSKLPDQDCRPGLMLCRRRRPRGALKPDLDREISSCDLSGRQAQVRHERIKVAIAAK